MICIALFCCKIGSIVATGWRMERPDNSVRRRGPRAVSHMNWSRNGLNTSGHERPRFGDGLHMNISTLYKNYTSIVVQTIDQTLPSPSRQRAPDVRHFLQHAVVNGWRRWVDLKDGRAEQDLGVVEGSLNIRLGDKDIGLATKTGWDGSGDVLLVADRALDRGNGKAIDESDIRASRDLLGGSELDAGARRRWPAGGALALVAAHRLLARAALAVVGEAWEGGEAERSVAGWARLDERGGQGVDRGGVEGSLEWVRHWDLADGLALHGSVERLDGEDGASNSEVLLVGDQRGGAEVGAGANVLKHGGESDEALAVWRCQWHVL